MASWCPALGLSMAAMASRIDSDSSAVDDDAAWSLTT
jgi:hypothetical protein